MSSASTKSRPAIYEDILRLPENVIGEIVDGELIVSPRPASRHAMASSAIGGELAGRFTGDVAAQAAGSSSLNPNFT